MRMMDSSAASVHAIPARWTTIESSKSFTKTHTKTTRLCADEGPGDLRPTSELPPIYVGKSSYDVVITDRSDYFSLEAFESANHASDSTKAQAHRRCLQYSPIFTSFRNQHKQHASCVQGQCRPPPHVTQQQ